MKAEKYLTTIAQLAIIVCLIGVLPVNASTQQVTDLQSFTVLAPKFTTPVAFDISAPLHDLVARQVTPLVTPRLDANEPVEVRPERGPEILDRGLNRGYAGDGALKASSSPTVAAIDPPIVNFEGISNTDNYNLFGFRVNPPAPSGDVGPNHYVEMVNLAFAVYDKHGGLLLGPAAIGSLWSGFSVEDCTDPSGDPIVLYDQIEDRWLLSQFTTRAPTYYNCVAISQTGDPTGKYYRYAFSSGNFFPDAPKYGVWTNSYILTTRDFGPAPANEYGISVYALEKSKMLDGDPAAASVQFFLSSESVLSTLVGDGLLPPDIDGRRSSGNIGAPIVGTQDNGGPYGAAFDALNVWELGVEWERHSASLSLKAQLPVAEFDSIFPCTPTMRDCLPQPGVINPDLFLDILSYRQRPTWRLAYRNFGAYESFVTSQSIEALPGIAGMRWYEIRRTNGVYSLFQQGTYAPNDGVHRWMGSIAQDQAGNIALGYSVVNGTDVFPGIRYAGRTSTAALGQMNLGEGTIINGSGIQRTTNSRWGDYTSMNIDPADDCTFWYVNEYYTLAGQESSTAGWQTRIASFRLPDCESNMFLPLVVKQ